jgi:hypothetical protein
MLLNNVELKFCHLDKPDDNGKYTTGFFCSNKDEEKALIELIETTWENDKGSFTKQPKSLSYNEYENPEDPNDKHNGKIIFNASQNAESGDGQYTFKVDIYDSAANLIEQDKVPAIGWGTIANVSVSTYCWTYKATKGVKLNLEAVQILDLVEYGGQNPFEAQESGFKAPTNPFNQPSEGPKVSGV